MTAIRKIDGPPSMLASVTTISRLAGGPECRHINLPELRTIRTLDQALAWGREWMEYSRALLRDTEKLRDDLADLERTLTSVTLERDFLLSEKRKGCA